MIEKLWTVPEISDMTRISRSALYKACQDKRISHYKFAEGIVRVPESAVRRYLGIIEDETWKSFTGGVK